MNVSHDIFFNKSEGFFFREPISPSLTFSTQTLVENDKQKLIEILNKNVFVKHEAGFFFQIEYNEVKFENSTI